MQDKRVHGFIDNTFYGLEDHGILTCYLTLDLGYHQSFGSLALTETTGPAFVNEVCSLFGASKLESLKGRRCIALYNFGQNNESIAGLETLYGKRFTIQSFRKKHHPNIQSPLDAAHESLDKEILRATEMIRRAVENKRTLDSRYTDWG